MPQGVQANVEHMLSQGASWQGIGAMEGLWGLWRA